MSFLGLEYVYAPTGGAALFSCFAWYPPFVFHPSQVEVLRPSLLEKIWNKMTLKAGFQDTAAAYVTYRRKWWIRRGIIFMPTMFFIPMFIVPDEAMQILAAAAVGSLAIAFDERVDKYWFDHMSVGMLQRYRVPVAPPRIGGEHGTAQLQSKPRSDQSGFVDD